MKEYLLKNVLRVVFKARRQESISTQWDEDIIQKINTKPSNVTIIKTIKRLKHIRNAGIWPFIKQI